MGRARRARAAAKGGQWDVVLSFAGAQRDYVEQVARAHGGSGIGLTIARALIAAHGAPSPRPAGPGTQLTITLPGAANL